MNVVRADADVDVLVVGAGLVGLAASALLARHGLNVLAVERHRGTSTHPKARLVNTRSMEIYRGLGVEEEILAAGEPNSGFVIAESMAGEHQGWVPPPAEETDDLGLSPCSPYSCDQQRIEPILARRASDLGAEVWFEATMSEMRQDADGITVRLTRNGGECEVRARYVVAADGADSGVRRRLGVGMEGQPVDGTALSVVFDADLTTALGAREVNALMATSAGAFLFARGTADERSWQLGTHLRPEWRSLSSTELEGRLVEVIRRAVGDHDLDPTLGSVMRWTTGAYVADRLRVGRVLLAGDSAHIMPPYGGFGGNTGVQDAHNLAWKLAAVCRGAGTEALLDTYPLERRPIAELTVAQALLRSRKQPGDPPPPDQIDAHSLVLGFAYPSTESTSDALIEDPRQPTGRPGTRAAHIALRDGANLYDLLDPTGFTLVRAGGEVGNTSASARVRAVTISTDEVAPHHRSRWQEVYAAAGPSGLLVRPDGVIATASTTPPDLDGIAAPAAG